MARLNHSELKALNEALLELYAPGPYTDLPARMFTTLRRCLSFDFFDYHEIVNNFENKRSVPYPDFNPDMQAFAAYQHQHPSWKPIIGGRLETSVKISDFATAAEWQRTDLYNHIFRSRGQKYQLAFITLDEPLQLGVGIDRSGMDFSEEDRSILNLLKPHLSQALTTSKLFSYYSDAAEGNGQAWIVANSAGRILFETGKAVDWLKEYFEHDVSLPTQLRDWLKRCASGLLETNGLALPLKDFSIRRGTKRLIVRLLSAVQSPEYRLLLSETNEELDSRPLQALALTKREAEVLLWISQGKRNSEIAEILGARSRTIGKHLERIFVKLSVETRTAAANMALEVLRSSSLSNRSSH